MIAPPAALPPTESPPADPMPTPSVPLLSCSLVGVLVAMLCGCAAPLPPTAGPAAPAGRLDAFVVAHPDDWQLFMGDVAWEAARAGSRTVFVYMTGGDAGLGPTYWGAREAGALASVAVLQGHPPPDSAGAAGIRAACAPSTVSGRTVRRCALGTSVVYFLRLPDGNLGGDGFAATGGWSLKQFADGGPAPAETLDGEVPFDRWQALSDGVAAILRDEAAAAQASGTEVRVHASDPDARVNPGEHEDHRATGRLAGAVAQANGWTGRWYMGYATAARPTNLSADRFAQKAALFMAYDRARLLANPEWSAYAEGPASYSAWLSRTYARPAAPSPTD